MCFVAWLFVAFATPNFATSNAAGLPDGPGKATVAKVCSGCHPAEIVATHRDTKDGWEVVVRNMVDKGANGTDDEFDTIIDYLATHFPKSSGAKSGDKDSTAKDH